MNIKASESAIERAKVTDGKVTKKRQIGVRKENPSPKPAPERPNKALTDATLAMTDSVKHQQIADEKRADEMEKLVQALLLAGGPLRVKVHRDMNRGSETYLLVTHFDFIPVAVKKRNLN